MDDTAGRTANATAASKTVRDRDAADRGPLWEEVSRLRAENARLEAEKSRALGYVRDKVNQLLEVMGTVPLRPEELDDATLLDLDPIGIVGESFAQVIEHLHETNRELELARQEIEAFFDSAGVGILVLDHERRLLAWNRQAAATVLGGAPDPAGRRCEELICGAQEPPADCTLQQALARREPFRRSAWVNRGRLFDVLATPIFDGWGEVAQVVLTYLDLTEREEAARALAESEERYRDLFENANDLIQSVAPDGTFVFVNRAWLETLGYRREEVAGLTVFDVIDPGCQEHCTALFQRIVAGEDVGRFEVVFRAKDGHSVVLEGTANCNRRDGRPMNTRGIFRDVTVRRRMEEEATRAQQLESLGVLAGGIAHDFNNLLTAILGNVTLARLRLDPGDEGARKLAEAERATVRARDLTHQLLTFSRGGAPVREEVSVAEVVEESARFALSGSGAALEVDVDEGLWSAELDRAQIGQVVQNLVLNADQSMAPRGGTIRVGARNVGILPGTALPLSSGPFVLLTVADQGPGIPPEHTRRVFDPYFTTKPGGSGLGLTTAYSIVQRHQGHLTFESSPAGTTFRAYLPATGRAAPAPERAEEEVPAGNGRILLMDDDELIRDAAGDLLAFLGYRVTAVPDGEEALAVYARSRAEGDPFDAVILDLTVPGGMGGREAVGKLLELDPGAKVVASSGYSNDPVMAEYRRHGFRAVAPKPYRLDAIAAILKDLIAP